MRRFLSLRALTGTSAGELACGPCDRHFDKISRLKTEHVKAYIFRYVDHGRPR